MDQAPVLWQSMACPPEKASWVPDGGEVALELGLSWSVDGANGLYSLLQQESHMLATTALEVTALVCTEEPEGHRKGREWGQASPQQAQRPWGGTKLCLHLEAWLGLHPVRQGLLRVALLSPLSVARQSLGHPGGPELGQDLGQTLWGPLIS